MGEPYQFSLGLGGTYQQKSVFGDQFQLKIDPKIQEEIDRIRFRLEFDRLRSQWTNPDWTLIDSLITPVIGPVPPPSFVPLTPTPPGSPTTIGGCKLQPAKPGKGPDTPRKGEASDVLKAVWALPEVKCAVGKLQDHVEHDWNRLGTGGKTLVISTAVVIGGAAIAGIARNDAARVWTLQKISDTDIPIPKTGGVSFKLLAPKGVITGGGIGFDNDVLKAGASYERMTLPDGAQFNNMTFTIQVNMLEVIPDLKRVF